MKKILLTIIILISCLIVPVVNAAKDDTNLYCEYSDTVNGNNPAYYMLIEFTSTNIDSFDYEFKTIPDGNDVPTKITLNNKNDLIKYRILYEDGHLQCPALAVKGSGNDAGSLILNSDSTSGDKDLYISNQSCPLDDCNFFNDPNNAIVEKPVFICFYLSQNSDKKIDIYRNVEGGEVFIKHPDGTEEKTSYPITETCEDFYYNTNTKQIKIARYNYLGNITQLQTYDPTMYDFICGSSRENDKNVEYFCEEGCNYPNNANIDCKEVNNTINKGNINLEDICNISGTRNALRFIGYLLLVVKILIPILLIIFGTIDYFKAMTSSDTDVIQKSTKALINRVIIGIAIFIVPTIINFVFRIILNDSGFNECRTCLFEPNNCD